MVIFDDGVAETAAPKGDIVDTDVLIVGSGPAGAALLMRERLQGRSAAQQRIVAW